MVEGAGNASGQTATAKVYIDPVPPNVPGITLSTEPVSYTHLDVYKRQAQCDERLLLIYDHRLQGRDFARRGRAV